MTEEPAETLRQIGMLLQTKRHAEGVAEADRFLGEHPDNAHAWRLKAFGHLLSGQLTKAHEAAGQCLRLEPDDTAALNTLGQSLLYGGRAQEALGVFNDLVAREPDKGTYHLLSAKALVRLHLSLGVPNPRSLDTIHEALTHAGTLDADRASTHSQAGDLYRELNLVSHAEVAYRRALELDPQYEDAVRGLSAVKAMRGRLRGAADHSALLMALNPRARGASRIMYAGITHIGFRVNHFATLVTPFALVMGAVGTIDEPGVLPTRVLFTLGLVCLPAWHLVKILAIPANVRRYMRGFDGFTGWMAGLVAMPVALLLLGLVPMPWGLPALPLLLCAYLWQRRCRNRLLADIVAREQANARSSAR